MPASVTFTFGPFIPDAAAHIEETGGGKQLLLRRFPFVNGTLAINAGFASRRWKASCLLKAPDVSALISRRKLLRSLCNAEDILTVIGESFNAVILLPDSLYFGAVRTCSNGFLQETEMEFLQLRNEESQ